jgi:Restriction Enzyme Adenine Methylase Associated
LWPHLEAGSETKIRFLRAGDGFSLTLDTTGRVIHGYVVSVGCGSAAVMVTDRTRRVIHVEDRDIDINAAVGLQHWCLETLVIPDGSRHELGDNQHKTIGNSAQPGDKGESTMAKKAVAKKEGRKPALAAFVDSSFKIYLNHGGKEYEATVLSSGVIRYKDKDYASPSTVGTLICGQEVNGWRAWSYKKGDEYVALDTLRGKASPLKPPKAGKAPRAKAAPKKAAKPPKAGKAVKRVRKPKPEQVVTPEQQADPQPQGEEAPF